MINLLVHGSCEWNHVMASYRPFCIARCVMIHTTILFDAYMIPSITNLYPLQIADRLYKFIHGWSLRIDGYQNIDRSELCVYYIHVSLSKLYDPASSLLDRSTDRPITIVLKAGGTNGDRGVRAHRAGADPSLHGRPSAELRGRRRRAQEEVSVGEGSRGAIGEPTQYSRVAPLTGVCLCVFACFSLLLIDYKWLICVYKHLLKLAPLYLNIWVQRSYDVRKIIHRVAFLNWCSVFLFLTNIVSIMITIQGFLAFCVCCCSWCIL